MRLRVPVHDGAGEPVIGVTVEVLKKVVVGGGPAWRLAVRAQTDDRGVYRAINLEEGDYIPTISTSPADPYDANSGHQPAAYPDVSAVVPVSLQAGESRSSVDLRIDFHVTTGGPVEGRVVGDGVRSGLQVHLTVMGSEQVAPWVPMLSRQHRQTARSIFQMSHQEITNCGRGAILIHRRSLVRCAE